ncbi:hypothetical protein BLAT2472_30217 [Burkholderia latens]
MDLVRAIVGARGAVRVAARRQGDRARRPHRVDALAGPAPAGARRRARQRCGRDRLRSARRVREAGGAQTLSAAAAAYWVAAPALAGCAAQTAPSAARSALHRKTAKQRTDSRPRIRAAPRMRRTAVVSTFDCPRP